MAPINFDEEEAARSEYLKNKGYIPTISAEEARKASVAFGKLAHKEPEKEVHVAIKDLDMHLKSLSTTVISLYNSLGYVINQTQEVAVSSNQGKPQRYHTQLANDLDEFCDRIGEFDERLALLRNSLEV